jgi:2,4-dienoyl-CoA reductase (NADPH2)
MLGGLSYTKVDDEGLHVTRGKEKVKEVIPCDTVIVCAGQECEVTLEAPLRAAGLPAFKIGGAHLAAELDAKRAIDQAARLAAAFEDADPERVGDYVAPLGMNGWLFQKIAAARG